ncbi:unnamed protein product, partial [Prorocentrum cordatum]
MDKYSGPRGGRQPPTPEGKDRLLLGGAHQLPDGDLPVLHPREEHRPQGRQGRQLPNGQEEHSRPRVPHRAHGLRRLDVRAAGGEAQRRGGHEDLLGARDLPKGLRAEGGHLGNGRHDVRPVGRLLPFQGREGDLQADAGAEVPQGSGPCQDYLRAMLTRDEKARASSEEIMVHKWVDHGRGTAPASLSASSPHPSTEKTRRTSDDVTVTMAPGADGKNNQDEKMGEGMRDDVNVGIIERRRELLERLNKEHAKAEKHRRGTRTPKEESQHFWAKWFTIADKRMGETLKFEWWGEEQVKKSGILAMAGMSQQPEDAHGDMDKSPLVVGQMLRDCDIDTKAFGTGRAKTLEQLAAEVQSGAARLMLDATDYKKLVRVVDVVLLRLVSAPAQEAETEKRILVETGEQYPDGRRRDTHRMPGAKKLPHETSKEVAQRVLKDFLNMDSVAIHFDFDCKEVYEEEEISPSFPGVTTVYRKEIVQCYVHETSRSALAMIGLPQGNNWTAEEANHQIRYLAWMTEEQAVAKGVKLRAEGSEEVSGLVMAPIGLAEDDLAEVLQHNGADPSLFGKGAAKSLKDPR